MNLNKGCIEITFYRVTAVRCNEMNLNKGCIEIRYRFPKYLLIKSMNLNKGCIEIVEVISTMVSCVDEP